MSKVIKKIKVMKDNGTFTGYIPIGADAANVKTEDGITVEEKIGKKTYYFNNIAEMKAYKLKNGDFVTTLGYYETNDGGGENYLIRTKTQSDIEDNDNIIFLDNDNLVAEKIKDNRIEFHAIAKSSATYICKFANGKNMIIDTGISTQWIDIKNAIDSLNITKFDYMIITHPHPDHIGNIQNLINNYDFTNCICWTGMKPDFINHASQIDEQESTYDNLISLLVNNGLNPIVPLNDSYYEIDNNTKLHFLNTSPTLAEDYYGNITEYRTERKLNFNHFSLVTEILHNKNNIICTGDIEKCVEKAITPFVHKADIITTPHHGVNRDAYKGFYDTILPEYSISMYITDSDEWVQSYYKSFMYLQDSGCRMITARWTEPVNGLFSFYIQDSNIVSTVLGENKYVTSHENSKIYRNLAGLINYTEQLASEVSVEDIFNNMIPGSRLVTTWWETYNNNFSSLFSELQSMFPFFYQGWILELEKGDSHYKKIKISYRNYIEYVAESYFSTVNWVYSGKGRIDNINGMSNLLSKIESLPVGRYTMNSYTNDITGVLEASGYILEINIIEKFTSNNVVYTNATVDAILRHTGDLHNYITRTARCYINTQNSPKYVWVKTNDNNSFLLQDTTGITNLISTLQNLPVGKYVVHYLDNDSESGLVQNGYYDLDITISKFDNNNITANIYGVLRDTGSSSSSQMRVVAGFINTASTPKYVWYKLNN